MKTNTKQESLANAKVRLLQQYGYEGLSE